MIIYIYKNTTLIAKPQAESMEEFKKNPSGFYPDWTNYLIASDIEFKHPKLVDGVLIEKTIEELKIEGLEPLIEGEKIVDNKLITVPKIEGLKVMWNGSEWIETATQEEKEEVIRMDIISKSSELLKIQSAGFNDLDLEKELETLKKIHLEITHQMAIK